MLAKYASLEGMCIMAKNVGGRRIGAIRGRTQFMLPNGHYAKRDRRTGEILSVKADLTPYRNVVIDHDPEPHLVAEAMRMLGQPLPDEPDNIIALSPLHRAA